MKYKTRFSLFFAAMILFNLAANFAHPVTPTIIQELGLPDYMFGLMFAMMMASNFLFSPFWGKINTVISSGTTLLISCIGYGIAQLGFAYGTTQGVILTVRALADYQKTIGYVPAPGEGYGEYASRTVLENLLGPNPQPVTNTDLGGWGCGPVRNVKF